MRISLISIILFYYPTILYQEKNYCVGSKLEKCNVYIKNASIVSVDVEK